MFCFLFAYRLLETVLVIRVLVKALRSHFKAFNFFIYKKKEKCTRWNGSSTFQAWFEICLLSLPFLVKCYVVLHLDHVLNVWQLVIRRIPLVTKKKATAGNKSQSFSMYTWEKNGHAVPSCPCIDFSIQIKLSIELRRCKNMYRPIGKEKKGHGVIPSGGINFVVVFYTEFYTKDLRHFSTNFCWSVRRKPLKIYDF